MKNRIGIRAEDKYEPERRSPLVPSDVKKMVDEYGVEISVESSAKRIFSDQEFEKAGADICNDLDHCDVITGVKEIPIEKIRSGNVYLFFSHVIKGQSANMPMLRTLMEMGCTLIDYERVSDNTGRRLIFFGRFAGLAGMINTLWTYGERMRVKGSPNAFGSLRQTYHYKSLNEAKFAVKEAGESWVREFDSAQNKPLVVGVTGDGNVAQGALEIMDQVPVRKTALSELESVIHAGIDPVILVNIKPQDYLRHIDGKQFELQHYIDHPDQYNSVLENWLNHFDIFVNGIYWDPNYPKLITKAWLKKNFGKSDCRLQVIGDITCDVHGSVECTERATEITDPVFIYDPKSDEYKMGFKGNGIAVMAVDILPSELPADASAEFSRALMPFVKEIMECNFSNSFEEIQLPPELKRATIVHQGKLTPDYRYLENYLD